MVSADTQIFCCRVADVDVELLTRYEDLLDDSERQRLADFQAPIARTTFLISRALLRTRLAARLNVAPTALQFIRDSNGKPQLPPPFNDWHFNLSHGDSWVTLALSRSGPVGIDVESHERRNNLSGIARRFFSAAENSSLIDLDDKQWPQQFFAIWTIKEAHAKALGCGLSKILSCSSFTIDIGKQALQFELSGAAAPDSAVFGWLYRLDNAVSLALVQLHSATAVPALIRCVPLMSEETLTLQPLVAGSWLPTN
jgi:phosphopantetheine--protein transferase-like protein